MITIRTPQNLLDLILVGLLLAIPLSNQAQNTLVLNGLWLMGESRIYSQVVSVPGIHTNPTQMNADTLWYKREVTLPRGNWKYATLELKGARFAPAVYVNGEQVARSDGGMAPTFYLLRSKAVRPGKTITLEVLYFSRSWPICSLHPIWAAYGS